MKYSFLSLIIGLILIAGAFLLIQKGNVSPFEVSKLQSLIDTNQIGENDYDTFDESLDDLIKSGQIDTYLNTSSIVIFLITISLGLAMFFFGVHTILDKLLFKKFFEKPNYKVALRRSFLLTGTLVGIMVLRYYRLEWNSVVLIFPFVLIVELTVIYFTSSSKSEEIDKKEEQIDTESDVLLTKIEDEIMSSFGVENTEENNSEETDTTIEDTELSDSRLVEEEEIESEFRELAEVDEKETLKLESREKTQKDTNDTSEE
jgi:Ca2+/Na+ antiporter